MRKPTSGLPSRQQILDFIASSDAPAGKREIARAFLASEPTVAQRIVRAKRTLAEANVPFEIPRREELPARLAAVLGVIYLVFNEGYAATSGEDWVRPALCEEALRLGRVLAALLPGAAAVALVMPPDGPEDCSGRVVWLSASRLPKKGDCKAMGPPLVKRPC